MTRFIDDYALPGWTLGETLAMLRRHQGLTQHDLARQLNVSRASISMIECDLRLPTVRAAVGLGAVLCVNPDDLLGEIVSQRADRQLVVESDHWRSARLKARHSHV